jgi:hypothetical protein
MDFLVLANAAKQAADFLDIDLDQLYGSHRHEIDMILVKDIYKPLFNIMGGHRTEMRNWMKSDNSHLSGIPKELIMREGRLNDVVCYLERFK